MTNKRKIFRVALLSTIIILVALTSSFLVWANDYYRADDTATAVMANDSSIKTVENLTILTPNSHSDTGIIFYPGAKVEAISYLPLLENLKNKGFTCVLVKMPLNMAIFDSNAADKVYEQLPEITNWYIAGHSMGGAMASNYASKNADKVNGLILMGAYIYGDYPEEKALTIYGSFNDNLEPKINYTQNIIKIDGGNHAQFGNYGKQKGDPDATITAQMQQDITVEAILEFINN